MLLVSQQSWNSCGFASCKKKKLPRTARYADTGLAAPFCPSYRIQCVYWLCGQNGLNNCRHTNCPHLLVSGVMFNAWSKNWLCSQIWGIFVCHGSQSPCRVEQPYELVANLPTCQLYVVATAKALLKSVLKFKGWDKDSVSGSVEKINEKKMFSMIKSSKSWPCFKVRGCVNTH